MKPKSVAGKYAIVLSPSAQKDLDKLLCWYEAENPSAGRKFVARFNKALVQLSNFPLSAPQIEDGIRRMALLPSAYLLYYTVDLAHNRVHINGMLHAHQRPQEWRKRF